MTDPNDVKPCLMRAQRISASDLTLHMMVFFRTGRPADRRPQLIGDANGIKKPRTPPHKDERTRPLSFDARARRARTSMVKTPGKRLRSNPNEMRRIS